MRREAIGGSARRQAAYTTVPFVHEYWEEVYLVSEISSWTHLRSKGRPLGSRNNGDWEDVTRRSEAIFSSLARGLRDLSPEARDRLREQVGGDAAAVARGKRVADAKSSARPNRVPQATTRRTTQRPPSVQWPAVDLELPSNLSRDAQARYRGNQREIATRQYVRHGNSSYGGRSYSGGSYGRSGGYSGGGGRGGGRPRWWRSPLIGLQVILSQFAVIFDGPSATQASR